MSGERVEGRLTAIVATEIAGYSWLRRVALAGVVGLVYFLLGYFVIRGLRAAGLGIVWPAAGFVAGILIVLGPRARLPAVLPDAIS